MGLEDTLGRRYRDQTTLQAEYTGIRRRSRKMIQRSEAQWTEDARIRIHSRQKIQGLEDTTDRRYRD